MSAFLTIAEKTEILEGRHKVIDVFLQALKKRVYERVKAKSLLSANDNIQWYYPAAEYLSDASMLYALLPEKKLAAWINQVTLTITRKSAYDWVGPAFRDHGEPLTGHLETAHLCWGVSTAVDLSAGAFSPAELKEVRSSLRSKGIVLCENWLIKNNHLANWRGIMSSGALVASAVLEDETGIEKFCKEIALMKEAFQPDGSYGESLQYGNYLASALMIAYECLVRKYPQYAAAINVESYAKSAYWMAQSMMYRKPLGGAWGDEERARAVNFNDSAAIFRPSGDLLLHIAARYRKDEKAAGLCRWMFKEFYEPCPDQGPHDLASFGMRNDWGFLTLPLLLHKTKKLSPLKAGLPLTGSFSNGNTFVRNSWKGHSILAIQAGNNDGCFAPGHLQGDLNSFILAFNKERLLADAGHSCYRNIIHGLESATHTHNTCTFLTAQDSLGLQEDIAKIKLLEQTNILPRRTITDGKAGSPVDRLGTVIHCERLHEISVVISEAGRAYGHPIEEFYRCWLQIGAHITVIIDRISASRPVKTVWNWVINNRDGKASVTCKDNCMVVKRPRAALKLFNAGDGVFSGPVYAHLHDAYHVEPNQLGEGASGSGLLYRFTDTGNRQSVLATHVIISDHLEHIDRWQVNRSGQEIIVRHKNNTCEICVLPAEKFLATIKSGNELITLLHKEGKYIISQTHEQ